MIKTFFAAALLSTALFGPAQAATVFFDDFESNTLGTPIVNGTQNISGWTVTDGTVDVIGTGFYQWYGTGRYLDMNGSSGTPGRIERAIGGLTAGRSYTLSFNYGYNQYSGTNERLSFGIANLMGALNPDDFEAVVWSAPGLASYSFKASATSHSLFFADSGETPWDNGGPILDNVRIELSPVPLPAAAPLLVAALGGLALFRRRRRS
jgi:hypothetical protein